MPKPRWNAKAASKSSTNLDATTYYNPEPYKKTKTTK